MSALEALIADEIGAKGPLTVARFMELALQHPEHGYYRKHDALGARGDFTSAPEISQMFGEIIALWLAQAWAGLGRPSLVHLVELGPGRGTMMADMLRSFRYVPGLREALRIHLVESSERLRALQRERLQGVDAIWHEGLDGVPQGPLLLVANEFFDALPVHQLVRTEAGWVERRIGRGAKGKLSFLPAAEPSPLACAFAYGESAPLGTVAEVSPARAALAHAIASRLVAAPGVALIIDYGAWADAPTGDTLQAVRAHAPADPLALPGEADLSAHVDFRSLAEAARSAGADAFGPVPQGAFLRALGIDARAVRLLARADARRAHEVRSALFRLTDASAMGELFKVLALSSPDCPPPPGFVRGSGP